MSKPVTAADVRSFYASNPKRFAGLSESAQHTAVVGQRGRLSPEVIKDFNKGRRNKYVLGAQFKASKAHKEANAALRAKAVEAGLPVPQRGPLTNAVKAALA